MERLFNQMVQLLAQRGMFTGKLLVALDGNRTAAPTFRDGLATDYVTDAVLKSAKTKKWEAVPAA